MSLEGGGTGPESAEKERIVEAAIRHGEHIYRGRNHHEALTAIEAAYPVVPESELEDGFITSRGRFVNREEAARIAYDAEQLQERFQKDVLYRELYMEDTRRDGE